MTNQDYLEQDIYSLVRQINDLAFDCDNPEIMHLFVNASGGEYYHDVAATLETLRKLMEKAKAFKSDSKTSQGKSSFTREDPPFEKTLQ
tara:strand:- start:573 stop:839 length:267 start_codon:yes stop_codon:yes gene_type:complete